MSRKMRLAGHAARMEKRNAYRLLAGKPEGRDHYENLDVGGRIILKWTSERKDVEVWTDLAQDRDQWRALVNAVMNLRVS
jgi:hypothetical protein